MGYIICLCRWFFGNLEEGNIYRKKWQWPRKMTHYSTVVCNAFMRCGRWGKVWQSGAWRHRRPGLMLFLMVSTFRRLIWEYWSILEIVWDLWVRTFGRFNKNRKGGVDMGDKGKKDKGRREEQKKAKQTLKEKRKKKKEKRNQWMDRPEFSPSRSSCLCGKRSLVTRILEGRVKWHHLNPPSGEDLFISHPPKFSPSTSLRTNFQGRTCLSPSGGDNRGCKRNIKWPPQIEHLTPDLMGSHDVFFCPSS